MSGRDLEPKKPSSGRPGLGRLGFLGRTKAMSSGGSTGWEATTIGFTLVGCIAAGSGLGYWLDTRFGTSFWLPILFLVGVAAGFREMFLVMGRISKDQAQQERKKEESVKLAPHPNAPAEEPQTRKRIFQVPPPPVPGQQPVEFEQNTPESMEDLIERLLDDDKDEDEAEPKKSK
jgi:F0F1-type ATP synthase assembly protein I